MELWRPLAAAFAAREGAVESRSGRVIASRGRSERLDWGRSGSGWESEKE